MPSGDRESDHHDDVKQLMQPTLLSSALYSRLEQVPTASHHLIIECNVDYQGGIEAAKAAVREFVRAAAGDSALDRDREKSVGDYVYACLNLGDLQKVMAADGARAMGSDMDRAKLEVTGAGQAPPKSVEAVAPPAPRRQYRSIRRVWRSTKLERLTTESIRTVKADAAHAAFMALGDDIVWAVLDSGVDRTHPHFKKWDNILADGPLMPKNFSPGSQAEPLADSDGHGTHVAGIIAGQSDAGSPSLAAVQAIAEDGTPGAYHLTDVTTICGMAPKCKILSLRIFDDSGDGDDTAAVQALEYVMELNSFGAHIRVHGVNLSAGYLPQPESYGIGQSPLCRTIDRLVNSGVVVVCAAGNFGWTPGSVDATGMTQPGQSGALASIADPGNARYAITVGSTHRVSPHTFGVSFFSSKGPTVDGRMKPDVVAPGERIISCATGALKAKATRYLPDPVDGVVRDFSYTEDTGTSMSAPHVSGVLAAFLSVRREFIGDAERVAALMRSSAVDLERDPRTQGSGLVDLFRMLQSV